MKNNKKQEYSLLFPINISLDAAQNATGKNNLNLYTFVARYDAYEKVTLLTKLSNESQHRRVLKIINFHTICIDIPRK